MLDGSEVEQTHKTNLRKHHLELTTPRTTPTRRIKDIYRVCYINLPHGNLLFASLSSPLISLLRRYLGYTIEPELSIDYEDGTVSRSLCLQKGLLQQV